MLVLYFRFHTMRYRFDAEGIHMAWGILMRHERLCSTTRAFRTSNCDRISWERWLGLARIEIQTASGSSGSEMTLEVASLTTLPCAIFFTPKCEAPTTGNNVPTGAGSADSLAGILTEVATRASCHSRGPWSTAMARTPASSSHHRSSCGSKVVLRVPPHPQPAPGRLTRASTQVGSWRKTAATITNYAC